MAGLILGVLFAGSCLAASADQNVEYMVFEGGGPDQGPGPNMKNNMTALLDKFGPVDPSSSRMIGYGVQQIRILSRSTAAVAERVNEALDAAERTGIPVWLHIDPIYGWGAETEASASDAPAVKFWKHPEMREWREFPGIDDKLPGHIPRLWFCWGPWCSLPAFPAIGSPAFVEFARTQLRDGVLVPLAARLDQWNAEGREYLFAGINVGWEDHIPQYPADWASRGPIRAEYPETVAGLAIDENLFGAQLGYASLYWRGWDEKRLVDTAAEKGISRDQLFLQLGYECIHDYMQVLAKECSHYGVGPDKVYTHIVALATVGEPNSSWPPIWTAVNPYSTPGFTMDNKGAAKYDIEVLKQLLAEAPGSRGTGFGAVETYHQLGADNYVTDEASFREELDGLFGNGARVKVVYAAFPITPQSPEASFSVIRQWLKEGTSENVD
jgi:hypothetical protein